MRNGAKATYAIDMGVLVKAEEVEDSDPTWLRNAVLGPLEEADVEPRGS